MAAVQTVKNLQGTVKMLDGKYIPQVGLGVYEMTDDEAYQAVIWALEAGYRHVDTAEWYENEEACGRAIVDFLKAHPEVPRSEIFFTTKLKTNVSYKATIAKAQESLALSHLEYIDLYLLHSPLGGAAIRKECWEACIEAKKNGWVRSIGVSNYGEKHLREIKEEWGLELPVLNQIDLHPFMRRSGIVKLCEEYGILLEAWAPLVRALRFTHPVVVKVAEAHGKSAAQVLLRWSVQHGYIPIPKSVSQARIIANSDLFDFELTADEMAELDKLDEYLVTDWDVVDTE